MSTRLTKKAVLLFDSLRRTDENGNEYWSARELAKALTYTDYRNFLTAVGKARQACENTGINPADHFVEANLFRATQTEEKLRRENITGKRQANAAHYQVGAKVRQTIAELGGTMPEDLPVAVSIKAVESKQRKILKLQDKQD